MNKFLFVVMAGAVMAASSQATNPMTTSTNKMGQTISDTLETIQGPAKKIGNIVYNAGQGYANTKLEELGKLATKKIDEGQKYVVDTLTGQMKPGVVKEVGNIVANEIVGEVTDATKSLVKEGVKLGKEAVVQGAKIAADKASAAGRMVKMAVAGGDDKALDAIMASSPDVACGAKAWYWGNSADGFRGLDGKNGSNPSWCAAAFSKCDVGGKDPFDVKNSKFGKLCMTNNSWTMDTQGKMAVA